MQQLQKFFDIPKQLSPQLLKDHWIGMTMQSVVKLPTDKSLINGYQRTTDLYFILLAFGCTISYLFKGGIFKWWLQPTKHRLMNPNVNTFKSTKEFATVGCLSLQFSFFVACIISEHGKLVDKEQHFMKYVKIS